MNNSYVYILFNKRNGTLYVGYDNITLDIEREKRLKGASRRKKLELIEIHNPEWLDLYYEIVE